MNMLMPYSTTGIVDFFWQYFLLLRLVGIRLVVLFQENEIVD